jgi:PleD family two-component response regulator
MTNVIPVSPAPPGLFLVSNPESDRRQETAMNKTKMVEKKQPLILIVDDNPHNLMLLGTFLRDNGYEVVEISQGAQALDYLSENSPDLILLDIMMPDMDGYTICQKIKSAPLTRHIPVIFLTAKTGPDDVVRGFEVGGVDYVTKPFHAVELLARVKTHVEMKILKGIISICSKCKKIRDHEGFWTQIESYLEMHSDALFSHGLCKDCAQTLYGEEEWFQK